MDMGTQFYFKKRQNTIEATKRVCGESDIKRKEKPPGKIYMSVELDQTREFHHRQYLHWQNNEGRSGMNDESFGHQFGHRTD